MEQPKHVYVDTFGNTFDFKAMSVTLKAAHGIPKRSLEVVDGVLCGKEASNGFLWIVLQETQEAYSRWLDSLIYGDK